MSTHTEESVSEREAGTVELSYREAINEAQREAILSIAATWRALAEQRERLSLARPSQASGGAAPTR